MQAQTDGQGRSQNVSSGGLKIRVRWQARPEEPKLARGMKGQERECGSAKRFLPFYRRQVAFPGISEGVDIACRTLIA